MHQRQLATVIKVGQSKEKPGQWTGTVPPKVEYIIKVRELIYIVYLL